MSAIHPLARPATRADATGAHVVYLIESALTERDLKRWGINAILARGHRVTVIECAGLSFPHLAQDRSVYGLFAGFDLRQVATTRDSKKLDALLAASDIILCYCGSGGINWNNLPIFRALARARRPWVTFATNVYPGFNRYRGDSRPFRRLLDIVNRLKFIQPLNSILARLPRRWLGVPCATFSIQSGRYSSGLHFHTGPSTVPIFAHSADYERFLSVRAENVPQTETCVFLDEYLPFHRDLAGVGAAPPENPDHYYGCLRAVFARIEHELGLEVVIAASPRAEYEKRPGLFGSRRVVSNQSDRLIASSRLVLAHRSTSIGMAVMFRKPVLILSTRRQIRHWWHGIAIREHALKLGTVVHFIDDPEAMDLSNPFRVDSGAYDAYLCNYVKRPESPARPFWDIVLDAVMPRAGAAR